MPYFLPFLQRWHIIKTIVIAATVLTLGVSQGCHNSSTATDQNTIADSESITPTPISTPSPNDTLNVVSPDWGIAATLTAMGYAPIATGDMRVWDQWVGKPELPESVIDLGIRYQPNAELVAQLPVDMVIDNYFYKHARNLYGNVPTESVLFKGEGKTSIWEDYVNPTQKLGALIHRPEATQTYIDNSRTQIEQAGAQLHQRYPAVTTFAVVQFVDANNMRMYASNSLFNVAFNLMDYEFVALDEGNEWGFTSIQLGELAALDDDVCLLVIEPLSPLTQAQLQDSLVWQRLGYGQSAIPNSPQGTPKRCLAKLPPIWIYGGMSSVTELADNIAAAKLSGGLAQ